MWNNPVCTSSPETIHIFFSSTRGQVLPLVAPPPWFLPYPCQGGDYLFSVQTSGSGLRCASRKFRHLAPASTSATLHRPLGFHASFLHLFHRHHFLRSCPRP